jgi:hypothetical protein
MEALGTAGETMQVRYFALGKSKDVFKQGDLRNAQAINREVMFVEWQATKDGNINAFVVDLTQFRNRAMKAIAQRDPSLAEINWDFKQLEADLRRVLDNHANGRAGADGVGEPRRNAVNALLGIGTKTNRAANPLTGLGGKGSALKTLRLDAFDDIAGTGRQGFSFDYQKANGNFMPDAPAPRPDLDTDLPVRMPQQIPREAQGMPDVAASGRGDGMSLLDKTIKTANGSRYYNFDTPNGWLSVRIADHANTTAESSNLQWNAAARSVTRRKTKSGMYSPHELNIVIDAPVKSEAAASSLTQEVTDAIPKEWLVAEPVGLRGDVMGSSIEATLSRDKKSWKIVNNETLEEISQPRASMRSDVLGSDQSGLRSSKAGEGNPSQPAANVNRQPSAAPRGQAMPDVTITPDEARRQGLVGPVYHGSPDFKGRKFDPKYRARSSGLSRGGFSFTEDVASADGYAGAGVDSAQAAVDAANDVMRDLGARMEAGLKLREFADISELPEFNVRYADDMDELASYFNDLSKRIPKDLGARLRDAAKAINEPANPVVVEAYLRNPKEMMIDGKRLLVAENPDDIFVSAARSPQQ